MKSLLDKTEYSFQDIKDLIDNGVEEGLHLEFKDAASLSKEDDRKKEISKDVSAFANSAGGIIIYGLREKSGAAHEIVWVDSGKYSKDWLLQVIEQKVSRRIIDIEVFPITNPESTNEQILLVKIGPSNYVPHMAGDNCYYTRDSKGNVPMQEYLVREYYNRTGKTELHIKEILGLNGLRMHPGPTGKATKIQFPLRFQVQNIGSSIEKIYKLEIKVHNHLAMLPRNVTIINFKQRTDGNYTYFSFSNETFLFRDEIIEIGGLDIELSHYQFNLFMTESLILKLYYSNGIKEYVHKFSDIVTYENRNLTYDMLELT